MDVLTRSHGSVAWVAASQGADCLEQFRGMQTCFNAHPEYYKPVKDDDDEAAEGSHARALTLNR